MANFSQFWRLLIGCLAESTQSEASKFQKSSPKKRRGFFFLKIPYLYIIVGVSIKLPTFSSAAQIFQKFKWFPVISKREAMAVFYVILTYFKTMKYRLRNQSSDIQQEKKRCSERILEVVHVLHLNQYMSWFLYRYVWSLRVWKLWCFWAW